jgi:hypothetical protein
MSRIIQVAKKIRDLDFDDRVFIIQKRKPAQRLSSAYEPALAICDINVSIH